MKRKSNILLLGFCFLFGIACQQTVNFEKEKSEITKLHENMLQGFLNNDIEMLLSVYPEGSISIKGGMVGKNTREKSKQIFEETVKFATFTEATDIEEPIIGISADGSMAWAISQIKFKVTPKETGESAERILAELRVYEKKDSKWILVAYSESMQQY
jgi:ketosteroid isomerase-like protein